METGHTLLVTVLVVALLTDTSAFWHLDHSVLRAEALDTELQALFALCAEGVSGAVRLYTGTVIGGVEPRLALTSLVTVLVDAWHSVFVRVTSSARSRSNRTGEALWTARFAFPGLVSVVELVVAVHAQTYPSLRIAVLRGVAAVARSGVGACETTAHALSAVY